MCWYTLPCSYLSHKFFFLRRKNWERFFVNFILFVDVFAVISVLITVVSSGLSNVVRISPPGGGPITLARLTGFAAIACTGMAIYDPRRRVAGTECSWANGHHVMTGSRAPALFLGLVLLLVPVLMLFNRSTRVHFKYVLVLAAGLVLLGIPAWNYAVEQDYGFANRFTLITSGEQGESIETREDYYRKAWAFAKDSSGMGDGIGSWARLYYGNDAMADLVTTYSWKSLLSKVRLE